MSEEPPQPHFCRSLLGLELWILNWQVPRVAVALLFPVTFVVFGAEGLGVCVVSYVLYSAMIRSSGDYAPARWNDLMQENEDENERAQAVPSAGLHRRV